MGNDTNSITEQQKTRLLGAIEALGGAQNPGLSLKLRSRMEQEYNVDSHTKLSRAQMDDFIAWVSAGADIDMLDVSRHPLPRASDRARAHANAALITLQAARRELPLEEWKLVLEDLLDAAADEWRKVLPDDLAGAA